MRLFNPAGAASRGQPLRHVTSSYYRARRLRPAVREACGAEISLQLPAGGGRPRVSCHFQQSAVRRTRLHRERRAAARRVARAAAGAAGPPKASRPATRRAAGRAEGSVAPRGWGGAHRTAVLRSACAGCSSWKTRQYVPRGAGCRLGGSLPGRLLCAAFCAALSWRVGW